jgi:diacylglycerol kinase (CTP)
MLDADAIERDLPSATRKDIHIGRRLVHMANGVAIASAYALFFEHAQVIHIFGVIACVVYILDRVRIHYPEVIRRAPAVNNALFRAEEQVKESAMTPYAISILLTLITFPKTISIIAIYTLAIADPLSAIVGIRWGRYRIVPDKSVEGSLAFFGATLAITAAVLYVATLAPPGAIAIVATLLAAAAATVEMLPLRIDDNLTIPLAVGFLGWILCALVGVTLL